MGMVKGIDTGKARTTLLAGLLTVLLAALTPWPAASAAEVADTCAYCHPPLALPDAHPSVQAWGLEDCRSCHGQGTEAGDTLLRAMHLGHVENMGFDCTLCHVDAEEQVPRLRQQLDGMLGEHDGRR